MTEFLVPSQCWPYRVERICLSSLQKIDGTNQMGAVILHEIDNVVAIVAHQAVVPIIGAPGTTSARIKLRVGSKDLNLFSDGANQYALSICTKQTFVGDLIVYYDWPSDMIPFWTVDNPERPTKLAARWDYEWVLTSGAAYALGAGDNWTLELFVVVRCDGCL